MTFENLIFLINEKEEIFGFLIGYLTALYVQSQRELYENNFFTFSILHNIYLLIRTSMSYPKSIYF